MDKMLVDSMGNVVITNDGSTILKEMEIEHPAAKIMVEIAKKQDDEVGDGTTSAVIIAGELLRRAEELIDQSIHPTMIVHGYQLAAEKAQEILQGFAIQVKPQDIAILKKIAETAMSGKGVESARSQLCTMVAEAVTLIADKKGIVDFKDIKVEKKIGGEIEDSEIIRGVVIDKERVHPGMHNKCSICIGHSKEC